LSSRELRAYLVEHFAPPGFPTFAFEFVLTPGELCDLVEAYSDELSVIWNDNPSLPLAQSCAGVLLQWRAHPTSESMQFVGLWEFPTPERARDAWRGKVPRDTPVESVLDVRGRFALNFICGALRPGAPQEEIPPADLWEHISEHSRDKGIEIDGT
jgi:hypothetical protein